MPKYTKEEREYIKAVADKTVAKIKKQRKVKRVR